MSFINHLELPSILPGSSTVVVDSLSFVDHSPHIVVEVSPRPIFNAFSVGLTPGQFLGVFATQAHAQAAQDASACGVIVPVGERVQDGWFKTPAKNGLWWKFPTMEEALAFKNACKLA